MYHCRGYSIGESRGEWLESWTVCLVVRRYELEACCGGGGVRGLKMEGEVDRAEFTRLQRCQRATLVARNRVQSPEECTHVAVRRVAQSDSSIACRTSSRNTEHLEVQCGSARDAGAYASVPSAAL